MSQRVIVQRFCFLCWEIDHLTGLIPQGESEAVVNICSRCLWILAEGLRTMSLRGMDKEAITR